MTLQQIKDKKQIIIAVVGLLGSGKTEATQQFVERGFSRVGFNDVFYEAFRQSGLEYSEPNERKIREKLRQEFGMGVTALKSLPKVRQFLQEGRPVVIESLQSWDEYKIMKEKFGDDFRVLAIYAPPGIRYARLIHRPVRPLANDMAQSRDYAEIENAEKAGPIAMAEWTIANIGSKEKFLHEVDALIQELLRG